MEQELEVVLDPDLVVGRLWVRSRGGRDTATFEYDAAWLTAARSPTPMDDSRSPSSLRATTSGR